MDPAFVTTAKGLRQVKNPGLLKDLENFESRQVIIQCYEYNDWCADGQRLQVWSTVLWIRAET